MKIREKKYMDKNRNLAESEVIKKNQTNSGAEVINGINENAKESLCHRQIIWKMK